MICYSHMFWKTDKSLEFWLATARSVLLSLLKSPDITENGLVPVAYLIKDPTKKKEGALLFIKEATSVREGGEGEPAQHEFDWKDRLKSWK